MDQRIIGTTMPVLEFVLEPGESIQAQSGELSWKSQSVQMRTGTQMAGSQGLFGLAGRIAGGGSLFMTEYYTQAEPGLVAFAAKIPGQILPLELNVASGYLVHRSGFVCGTPGVEVTVGMQRSLGAGLFGGTGFVLQRLGGTGKAWVELSGEVVTYELDPGEVLQVHPGHVGLVETSVWVDVTLVPGIKNMLFGGDGLVLVTLTGPGKVWLQSMPLPQLAGALAPYLPSAGHEGGLHGAVGNPVGALGAAAMGIGVSAIMGGGGSSAPPRYGLLEDMAQAAPDVASVEDRALLPNSGGTVASGEDRAFLPNGGGPMASPVSDVIGSAGASGVDPSSGVDLSALTDAATNTASPGWGPLGSLLNAVGGLISNIDTTDNNP